MNNAIKKPIISEKSFQDAGIGKYTFVVDKNANKDVVARECEKLFGVTVLSVNIANIKGKVKMVKRVKGKRSDYKKAILTLKPGNKIDLFEIETEKETAKETKKEVKAEKAIKKETKKAAETKDVEVTIKEKK